MYINDEGGKWLYLSKDGGKSKRESKVSTRHAYIFPIVFAACLIAVDFVGVIEGHNHVGGYINSTSGKMEWCIYVVNTFFNYLPSNIASMMLYAVFQKNILGIENGLNKDYVPLIFWLTVVYVVFCFLGVYSTTGTGFKVVSLIFSVVYCVVTWFMGLKEETTDDVKANDDQFVPDAGKLSK